MDSTGVTRLIRSTELIARNTDTVRTYYHYASDEMGSTTHIVDETGEVQNRYEYDAWGNITVQEETVPNRFKFTGQQLDPITQQYYLRARFYNPVIARFTQEDTYRGDGLNLYAYCANNPVYYVDPTGHYSDCVKEAYDRIRRENPTLSASVAYQRALQERGFDKLSKEDNRRRSEAANLNRRLKDPNLTSAERERIFSELDKINNISSVPNQPPTPSAKTPTAESRIKEGSNSVVNSKGIPYPQVIDIKTGENMVFPDGIGARVDKDSRVGWYRNQAEANLHRVNDTDILCKKDYIDEWHRRGYETPEGGWGLYEIHHIKPREFGGSADFENMTPLLKDIHRKRVTPWWNSYGR